MKRKLASLACIVYIVAIFTSITTFARTDFQPGWPLHNGYNISALDVYQSGNSHSGIDVGHGNKPTQAVYAIANGVVTETGNKCSHHNAYPHNSVSCNANSLGNFVKIKHTVNGKTFFSQYAHLTKDSLTVKVGDKVTPDTQIGKMGSSGNSTGPHLHFAIWEEGCYSDRVKTFDFYKDNSNLMKSIRVREKLAKKSPLYGNWIKSNGTLKDGLYYFGASTNTTNSNNDTTNTNDNSNTTKPINEPSSIKISPNSYPSGNLKYGKDFTLTAKFTSDCAIVEARAYMLDSNKNVIQEAKGSSTTSNYYVEGYALDKGMKFDQLAPGGYYLKYYVKDANGDTATWTSNKFYIVKESSSNTSSNTTSTNTSTNNSSSGQTISDGVYVIASKLNTKYVLDINGASKDNCTNLQLWENNGSSAQTFKVTYVGNGYYQIVNTNSGKAIDVQNGDTAPGTNVWQYQINNTDAQLWKIVSAGNGSYHIIGKGSGLYLDVDNAYAASGSNVKIFSKNDAYDAQKWIFTKQSSSSTSSTSTSSSSSSSQQTASSTSIKFEIESMPKGNLPYGKSFSLKGWFRSDSAIVEARAYMLDANKNVVMQSEPASSTTSNYKIQGYKLDKAMKFNELSPGGYYLKFFVRDANGDTFTWVSDKFYIVK